MKDQNMKLCEISDIVPVRIFPDRAKKLGPIKPMLMNNTLIFSILNSRPAPTHFFAIDPNNRHRKVLLTKENYNKTTEELFGTDTPKMSSTIIEKNDNEQIKKDNNIVEKEDILISNNKEDIANEETSSLPIESEILNEVNNNIKNEDNTDIDNVEMVEELENDNSDIKIVNNNYNKKNKKYNK